MNRISVIALLILPAAAWAGSSFEIHEGPPPPGSELEKALTSKIEREQAPDVRINKFVGFNPDEPAKPAAKPVAAVKSKSKPAPAGMKIPKKYIKGDPADYPPPQLPKVPDVTAADGNGKMF